MTKQVQFRRGTDSQHTSFTGAEGEISVNTTNDSVHVHDGTTAGGKELARADGSNVAFTSGTIDGTTIGGTTPAAGTFTTGDFNTSLNVDGTITSDGLTVDGSSVLSVDSSSIATVLELRNDDKTDDNGLRLDFNSLDTDNNDNIFGRIEVEIKNHATEKSNMNFSIRNDSGNLTELFVLDKDEKVIMNGSVGIGTSSITSGFKMEVTGDARFGDAYNDDAVELGWSAGGSVGFVQAYDRGASAFRDLQLNNAVTITSGGSVGIGTSSPSTYDSRANNLVVGDSGDAGITIFSGATSDARLVFAASGDTGLANGVIGYDNNNDSLAFEVAGSNAMTLDASGNLGIGTSSITSLGTGITTLELKGNSASQSDRSGGIRFTRYDGSDGMYIYNADGASYIESRSTYPLLITTNNTERMRIDSSGRVGIGTQDPSSNTSTYYDDLVIKNDTSGTGAGITLQSNSTNGFGGLEFRKADGTEVAKVYGSSAGGHLGFETGGAERMRIRSDGGVGVGTEGSASVRLYSIEGSNRYVSYNYATNSGYTNDVIHAHAARTSSSAFNLIACTSGSDREFNFRGDGYAFADGSFSGGGSDYAEMFEWDDGNSSNEDRRGYSVVLTNGNKIRKATSSDAAADIIGIVSANPTIVGDAAWNKWNEKYNRDDFNGYIFEDYTLTEWTETVEDGDDIEHSYETDKIPSDVTAPADATVISVDLDGNTLRRRQLNPDYDETQTYTSRENRQEWDAIGMMGKLRMRAGQPTGDRWIKMRDIATDDDGNVTIEEWLVR